MHRVRHWTCGGNGSIGRPRFSTKSNTFVVAFFICDDCEAIYELTYQLRKVVLVNDEPDNTEQKEINLADESYRSDLRSMQGPGGYTI